jgi:hypothetical protein
MCGICGAVKLGSAGAPTPCGVCEPDWCRAMGEAARARARELAWPRIAARVEDLLLILASERSALRESVDVVPEVRR